MSTSLIVLLPVVLFGIVGLLCFVGCILQSGGLPPDPFFEYSGKTVLPTPSIIAYWPLGEASDTEKAAELVSGNVGNYIDQTTGPPAPLSLYPWPEFTVPNAPAPDALSAAAPGTIAFLQPGLVKGDAINPDIPAVIKPCVVVNGCFVEVPFNINNTKFIPQTSFTVEAWVRVGWTSSDPLAWRFVLDMRDFDLATGSGMGFGLFAKPDDDQSGMYRWAGIVGSGAAGFTIVPTQELAIALSSPGMPAEPVYLALTFDAASQMLTLFVNGVQQGQATSVSYVPNGAQPFWIGAGAPYVVRRAQPPTAVDPASPLFPFFGAIQDVAIYSAALTSVDIQKHFDNGSGFDP